LKDLMQRARAFVFAAQEDFGITLVEAQACGTPVIAFGKGGALETIVGLGTSHRPTGVFFPEQQVASLIEAIATFERDGRSIDPAHCRANALRFSRERFCREFAAYVEKRRELRPYELKLARGSRSQRRSSVQSTAWGPAE
jgi:glycosyltransferase involved in cell wall biosynthesis